MVRIQPPQPNGVHDLRRLSQIQLTFDTALPELDAHRIACAINSALSSNGADLHVTIRLVAPTEMTQLHRFKGGAGPTNVLTFVEEAVADIAICPQVAEKDAMFRGWGVISELSYLCVHGCLHALGYDHGDRASEIEMNRLERQILAHVGVNSQVLDP